MSDGLSGRIVQISASEGGVPKRARDEAQVDGGGITVDRQTDLRAHGGPRRALCLFALERIETLAAEGHFIAPGSTGENITTSGIDWGRVAPGARLRLGECVLVEVTDYAAPCWKNARWFADGDIGAIDQQARPGFSRVYARVVEGGALRPGDAVVPPRRRRPSVSRAHASRRCVGAHLQRRAAAFDRERAAAAPRARGDPA